MHAIFTYSSQRELFKFFTLVKLELTTGAKNSNAFSSNVVISKLKLMPGNPAFVPLVILE